MPSFALYRLPHQDSYTSVVQTVGDTLELHSPVELNGRSGFVVAPFSVTAQYPLLLIRPDVVESQMVGRKCSCHQLLFSGGSVQSLRTVGTDSTCRPDRVSGPSGQTVRTVYSDSFNVFHRQLLTGRFRKVVLSRCLTIGHGPDVDAFSLFETACRSYPRLFIALVYTPKSGLWLTATPEVLLDRTADHWHTIALAGTMRMEGDDLLGEGEQMRWSAKNIEEQRLVATYIADQLKPYVSNLEEEGPRTVRAANLVHLRSDFTFTLLNNTRIGDLLQALHPTPAVCGLPKDDAYRFILANEPAPRQYYSGFMGPLDIDRQTSLYVSLRCMQITPDHFRLYAGGGLLKDSAEELEWQETEAKLETMKRCIAVK